MKALIIAAGRGLGLRENGESKSLIFLLGLRFIERIILTAKKSGIEEFQIVIGYNGEKIRKLLGNGHKYGVKIDYIFNEEWKRGTGFSVLKAKDIMHEPFILLMADHLFDFKILKELQKINLDGDECVICVDRNHKKYVNPDDTTRVIIKDGKIRDIGKRITHHNGIDAGICLCSPAIFEALEQNNNNGNNNLSQGILNLSIHGKMKAFDISDKYWIDVDDEKDLKKARSLLIEQLEKVSDGPISKKLNRPVSIRITELLLRTNITPNQISLVSFIFGVIAALFFALGDYIYLIGGGILAQISSIIDGCDGEVARLKLMDTNYGGWFDAVLDRYADALIIFGMIFGHWTLHTDITIWIIGFCALTGSFLNSYTADKYDSIYKKRLKGRYSIRIGRDIRLFLIFLGGLIGQILPTLLILAIITNYEAIRRLISLRFEYVQKNYNRN